MDTLNILLVDDDRILVTTLSHGLRKAMGKVVSVTFCASGPEALALLASQATQAYNVVISDFNMPGMSGLELLKKIRQDHHETSLVLITAYATDALTEEVHQLGIGYMTKPFELPRLVQLIQDLIRGAETAKMGERTENAPHILAQEGNANSDHLMKKVLIDQEGSN